MANIKNHQDLERWLKGRPALVARAISARIALRVWPLIAIDRRNDLTLAGARACLISAVAGIYPTADMRAAAVDAALAAAAAADAARAAARAAAAAADAAVDAALAAAAAADAARAAARAAASAADAARAQSGLFWKAVSSDCAQLETARASPEAASALMPLPLWPDVTAPRPIESAWQAFKNESTVSGDLWAVWIDWYEQRLKGSDIAFARLPLPDDPVTLSIAQEDNGFWDRDAAIVNAEIRDRLDAALPPGLPPARPAALNPVWRDGRLMNDDTLSGTARPEDVATHMEALGLEYSELADDLATGSNIPPRTLMMLRRVAEQLAQAPDSRITLFRLVTRLKEMEAFSATVRTEWPVEDAARYHGLWLQLSDLLSSHPEIAEHLRTQADTEIETDKAANILSQAEQIAEQLGEEPPSHIDPAITDGLQRLIGDAQAEVTAAQEQFVKNARFAAVKEVINSVFAVLRSLVKSLFDEAGPLAHQSVKDTINKHAKNTGPYIEWVMARVWKLFIAGVGGGAVTTISVTSLAPFIEGLGIHSPGIAALSACVIYILNRKWGKKPPPAA